MGKFVKHAGVWKQIDSMHVKTSGSWRQVSDGWVNQGGVWQRFLGSHTPGFNLPGLTTGEVILYMSGRYLFDESPLSRSIIGTLGTPVASNAHNFLYDSSIYFNGSSGLTFYQTSDLSFPGDFTIGAWVYKTASGVLSFGISHDVTEGGFYFGDNGLSSDQLLFYLYNTGLSLSGGQLSPGWNHIAVSRVISTLRMFINGVNVYTNETVSAQFNRVGNLYIGYRNGAPFSNGYVQDFFMVRGQGIYTANFTPPGELTLP